MRIGIIGMGFMGGVHLNAWQLNEQAEVVAVCNTSPILEKTKGNIDTGSEDLNLVGVRIYTDVPSMLEQEALDAVSVTLPTHLHKAVSIQCLEAGVHVLCEKPMALNVEDCDSMISAAEAADKKLMIAQCIRFWPAYVWLKETVDRGKYGEVKAADFSRLTYAPVWSGDSWFSDQSKSGGIALDLHIHDLDFIQHLFGTPESQQSKTSGMSNDVVGHVITQLNYGDEKIINATASWLMPESYGFSMSFNVVFEQLAVVFEGNELKAYPVDAEAYTVELPDGDGYLSEINYFADLLSGSVSQPLVTPEQTRESVRMALETIKS